MTREIFVKQLDGCTYCSGGLNCTCASHAMWLYRASQGKIVTTSCAIRRLTNDTVGGTHLGQMEKISIQYGITAGRVYRPITFTQWTTLIATRRYGSHLNVGYGPIAGTRYDCFSGQFRGNHDYFVSGPGATAGTMRVGDPGADGRRAGIPTGYQDIPITLLRRAAAALDFGGHPLGDGLAYAYVTPPDPIPTAPHYRASVIHATALWNDGTKRWVYNGSNAIKVGTVLEVRGAQYIKGNVACYPVTSGACSNLYPGYYVPVKNVKLGGKC